MLPTLTFIDKVIRERQLTGGATVIYTHMFFLAKQPDFDIAQYPGIHAKRNTILETVAEVKDRKARLHRIADFLVEKLRPRFVSDGPLLPGETREDHCADWMHKNRDLDPGIDFGWVFAGFLAMFDSD